MRLVRSVVPPVVVGIVALLGWELTVRIGRVAPFVLPEPSAIWTELVHERSNVWDAALTTGLNALIGLLVGAVAAVLLAMVASRVAVLRKSRCRSRPC